MMWWHEEIMKHTITSTRVTVGMFDTSKGILFTCSCGETWAK